MNEANILSDSRQFLDLHISIFQGKFNKRICDRDDFSFPIVNFPSFFFFDGDVPLASSYRVYISH